MRVPRPVLGMLVSCGASLLAISFVAGCGSESEAPQAAELSPEAQKKTNEMLSNYGKNYNADFKAKAAAKRKK